MFTRPTPDQKRHVLVYDMHFIRAYGAPVYLRFIGPHNHHHLDTHLPATESTHQSLMR